MLGEAPLRFALPQTPTEVTLLSRMQAREPQSLYRAWRFFLM